MKKFLIVLFLSGVATLSLSAADSCRGEKMFDLYITGNILQWEEEIEAMRNDTTLQSFEEREELLTYYYGLIGHLIGAKEKQHAEALLREALELIKPMLEESPQNGRLYGLMANFQGYQIAISPLKATTWARSMLIHAKRAQRLLPDDPEVNIWSANILFYMPDALGGDSKSARNFYNRALEIYENEACWQGSWLYVQLLVSLALVEEKAHNYEAAWVYVDKAYGIYPDYPYLRDILRPRILGKMADNP
ncbi:MAG: hypothetical protein LUI04_06180 [Porphyromonadaceae bacterium]|nr:hypothetical protein [Porphyromonadaceae bacterium]